MVERGEVVVVELDLRALHHPVAEPDEDVLDLAPGLVEQVQVASRDRRHSGQGDVDRVAAQRALEIAASSSRGGWRSRSRGPRAPRSPRSRRDRAAPPAARRSRAGSRSAPTFGPGSGPAARRARGQRAPRDRRLGLGPQLVDPLHHQLVPSPAADDIRPRAIAAAAATLSDSAGPATGLRRAAGSSSAARSRRAPRRAVPLAQRRGRGSARPGLAPGARRRGRASRSAASASRATPARAIGRAKIEPMLARTAFGE